MAEPCKFDELRIKTDLELLHVINSELELGIQEAYEALRGESWAVAETHFLRAQRAHATASHLLPLLTEFSDRPTEQIEARRNQLRKMLDQRLASTPNAAPSSVAPQEELRAVCC